MFWDILNKGKEIADKVTNLVLNQTELEMKVREATNDDPWGPHGQVMYEIAECTYNHSWFLEIMETLWKRLHPENPRYWRRVYKSLLLLDFLLKNGSENVALGAREHIYDIRSLESFHYIEDSGKDQGINVRLRVKDIIDLLQDPKRLKAERAKAKANRHLYTGRGMCSNSNWQGSYTSNRRSFSPELSDMDETPAWSAREPSPANSDRSTGRSPDLVLSSFDDWHVGKERGLVDDVVEQLKDAWNSTKVTARDILYRGRPEWESDLGAEPMDNNNHDNAGSHGSIKTSSDSRSMRHSEDMQTVNKRVEHRLDKRPADQHCSPTTKPTAPAPTGRIRPPSGDLICAWSDSNSSAQPPVSIPNLIDLPTKSVSSTNVAADFAWFNDPTESVHQPNMLMNMANKSNVPVQLACDNEFGDFVSATPQTASNQSTYLPTAVCTALTPPQSPLSSETNKGVSEKVQSSPSIPMGQTWKEMSSLGIDLDRLTKPDWVETGAESTRTTRPSLLELQAKKQSISAGTAQQPFGGFVHESLQPIPVYSNTTGVTNASNNIASFDPFS